MSHEDIDYSTILRQRGYRVTPQRLVVLDALCDVGDHANFAQVFQRARELDIAINQATVYRALAVLSKVGLIVSAEFGDQGKVYEIAGREKHHHLMCRQCGKEYGLNETHLQTLVQAIFCEFGFKIESDHLVMMGLCKTCLEPK